MFFVSNRVGDSNLGVATARWGTLSWSRMLPSAPWRDLGTSGERLSCGLAHVPSTSTRRVEPHRVFARRGSFVTCLVLSACGPDCALRVQRDPSDEAALSSAALPFASPCRAGAVADFRASSILSGLWAGDPSPLFLFLECSAHFIPGKPLSFLSFGAASPGIFPLSSVPSRLL